MSGALKDIGQLVEELVSPIADALEKVIKAIGSVIEEILQVIGDLLSDILHFITHHFVLLAIILIIVIIVLAIIAPEILILIWAEMEAFFAAAWSYVELAVEYIVTGITIAAKWIASSWSTYVQPSLKYLSDLNSAAQVVADLKQGKYGKAFVDMFDFFDTKLSKHIQAVIGQVTGDISKVRKELTGAISTIEVTVETVSASLGQAQSDLNNIASAFDVGAIANIADGVKNFRDDILGKLTNKAEQLNQDIGVGFNVLLNPLSQVVSLFASAQAQTDTVHHLFAAFSLTGVHHQFPSKVPEHGKISGKLPPFKFTMPHGAGE